MRSVRKQINNIKIARGLSIRPLIIADIHTSGHGRDDIEEMVQIVTTKHITDAIKAYEEADTLVREYIQEILERAISKGDLEERYKLALELIGGTDKLLALPEPLKKVLENTTDLKTLVELLEAIAEIIEN